MGNECFWLNYSVDTTINKKLQIKSQEKKIKSRDGACYRKSKCYSQPWSLKPVTILSMFWLLCGSGTA